MARRAPRFHGFVGHRKVLAPLRREQEGAKARGEPLLHLMITGPSGVGKTELTRALAQESESRLVRVMGYAHRDVLLKKLHSLEPGDFLLIDEAHAMKLPEQEMLFEVIDRGKAPRPGTGLPAKKGAAAKATAGKGGKGKSKSRRLPPFTLVLATDRPSHLVNALQKRMTTRLDLTPYPLKEMKEIVEIIAAKEQVLLSPQAARQVARVSHGLPRRAKQLVQKLRLFARSDEKVSVGDVHEFLRAHGIDRDGLGPREQRYLRFLKGLGKASLDTLAQYLGTDRDDVLLQVEPPLVRKKLVVITASGRRLTEKGKERVAGMKRRKPPVEEPDEPSE